MDIILNESRQVYISKINRVQDYIESHMDEELCIGQLARVAFFSEFHFERIFRQFTGESPVYCLHVYVGLFPAFGINFHCFG